MSEMVPAAAVARCVRALPEDVVVAILERVPDVVSLFRCAVVCKEWRRLVSDPAFLRRRPWPEGALDGFFMQPYPDPILVPAPGSALGPRRRFLTSFVRNDAGVLYHAVPLAARDGLLLVRLAPPSLEENSPLHLCVCNLLTGRRDLLPPLDTASLLDETFRGYAVLTAADHGAGLHRPADGYSTFFQVLVTGIRPLDGEAYIVKFSSDFASSRTWNWSYVPRLMEGISGILPRGSCVAVVTRGIAHWLFLGAGPNGWSLLTLDASINSEHVGATEIPLDVLPDIISNLLFGSSYVGLFPSINGKLSLFYLDAQGLRIWSQQDGDQGGTGVWCLTEAILGEAELGLSKLDTLSCLSTMCIGEKSSTILVRYDSDPDHAYVVHLRSRSTAMVAGWNRSFNYGAAVPCEMNWLEFFASRLGVQL